MSNGEDDTDDAEPAGELDPGDLETRLDDAAEALENAETEADLDAVETTLDDIETDLEAVNLPEPDDEDEEDASVALPTRRLVTHNVPDGLKVCHSFPLTSLFPKTIYCTREFNVNLVACFDHCIILWLCCISIEA
jgi:hypothetical protein